MAIKIIKEPKKYSFTGNPVVFELSTESDEPVPVEISDTEGGKAHSTMYYPFLLPDGSYKINMNISDFLHFDNTVDIPKNEIISVLQGFSRYYYVKIGKPGDSYIFYGYALRGGIGERAMQRLHENGYDMFTYRLSQSFEQFLFTTRTNGKEIRVKETELYPFVFMHPGLPVVFKSESGDEISTLAQPAGTFCAMDLRPLTEQFPPGTRRIEVCPSGQYAFHFTVLPGKSSEERYLLRFRNSLGAFEMLEITGRAMHAPEFSEENLWETLTDFDFYEERRSRVKSNGIIEMETGYKERDEFPFIIDLIQSAEIYFIYPDGDSFRCHVKTDGVQYRNLMTEPTSVKLKIRPVVEEEFLTPKIEFPETGDVSITLSTNAVSFSEIGGIANIDVIIKGTQNKSYSVEGLPDWLKVSNKTANGFTLTAEANMTEDLLSLDLIVRLDAYPTIEATLSVTQSGAWLSVFIFDILTTSANQNVSRIVNLGAVVSGEALFDYDDGTPVEIKIVPKSIPVILTDQSGNEFIFNDGTDFGHVFNTSGTHTVTIKIRQGVNAFRFSSVPEDGNVADWGATFEDNPYITNIYRIKSDSQTSMYKMFAGVINGKFPDPNFALETPNITDTGFAFERFGCKGKGMWQFTVDDDDRFPIHMFDNFTKKNQITGATRMYFNSGFPQVVPEMLSFAAKDTLISVFETFRAMWNLGANWTAKKGVPNNAAEALLTEEIIVGTIFQNQRNISTFEGTFNNINDFFGTLSSGYAFPLILKADLFKNNAADNININWMFNKFTRAILEVNFFRHIGQRIKSMNGCFWNFGLGSPRVGWADYFLEQYWGARIDQHPEGLFPDNEYRNIVSMVGAFGYYGGGGAKRNIASGFNGLWDTAVGQIFDHPVNSPNEWGLTLNMASLNIAAFLNKFPGVTQSSGVNPVNGQICDGAAFNFGDWDTPDSAGVTRANDFVTYGARPQVKQHIPLN